MSYKSSYTGSEIDAALTKATALPSNFYEDGVWTPTLGGNTTYSLQVGRYTRIGKLVIAQFEIGVTALGSGSPALVYGLPYPVKTGTNPVGYIGYFGGLNTGVNFLAPNGIGGQSYMIFSCTVGAVTSMSQPFSAFKDGTLVLGTLEYYIA